MRSDSGAACTVTSCRALLAPSKYPPLRDIISSRNPAYMALIEEQQQGNFRPVCQSCDMYASIYHKSSAYRKEGVELETLAEFKQRLS